MYSLQKSPQNPSLCAHTLTPVINIQCQMQIGLQIVQLMMQKVFSNLQKVLGLIWTYGWCGCCFAWVLQREKLQLRNGNNLCQMCLCKAVSCYYHRASCAAQPWSPPAGSASFLHLDCSPLHLALDQRCFLSPLPLPSQALGKLCGGYCCQPAPKLITLLLTACPERPLLLAFLIRNRSTGTRLGQEEPGCNSCPAHQAHPKMELRQHLHPKNDCVFSPSC